MATYKQIADHVFAQSGRRVHHECWIAHVLADYGLTKRVAPNRQGADRKKKCPVDMRPKIVDALQHFGMIDPR